MGNKPDVRYSRELRCQELVELITDYIEGTMASSDRMCFEQHLARCEGCSNYLAEMRKTIEIAGTLREEWMRPSAKEHMLAVFRNWKNEPRT